MNKKKDALNDIKKAINYFERENNGALPRPLWEALIVVEKMLDSLPIQLRKK